MLAEERLSRILELVNRKNSVKLQEVCEELDISESTARRDLKELADRNLINKVHGGAMAKVDNFFQAEANMEEKSHLNTDEKYRIGRYAASLVEDGDCIFVDAGTTTGAMIEFITAKNVRIVTNAMDHALYLAKKGYQVLVTGGQVKASTEALVGTECIKSILRLNFTKSFMGANGISLTRGITTPDSVEATTKEVVIQKSDRVYVLADHSKFDKVTTAKFTELDHVVVITDHLENLKYKEEADVIEADTME